MLRTLSARRLERRLDAVAARVARATEELEVAEAQLVAFLEDADDLGVRAMVSEGHGDQRPADEARRHADALTRHRDRLRAELEQLRREQGELFDRLLAAGPR